VLLRDYDALLVAASAAQKPALPHSLVEAAGFGALSVLLEAPMEVLIARR
jgi:hypothetical protein